MRAVLAKARGSLDIQLFERARLALEAMVHGLLDALHGNPTTHPTTTMRSLISLVALLCAFTLPNLPAQTAWNETADGMVQGEESDFTLDWSNISPTILTVHVIIQWETPPGTTVTEFWANRPIAGTVTTHSVTPPDTAISYNLDDGGVTAGLQGTVDP